MGVEGGFARPAPQQPADEQRRNTGSDIIWRAFRLSGEITSHSILSSLRHIRYFSTAPGTRDDSVIKKTMNEQRSKLFPAMIGALWCLAVIGSYYVYNFGYYREKLSVFGNFFLKFLN